LLDIYSLTLYFACYGSSASLLKLTPRAALSLKSPRQPVPQRMNFFWGVGDGQESPPIKVLLRMVQHLSLKIQGAGLANNIDNQHKTSEQKQPAQIRNQIFAPILI
jgi:hypothetical protein